MPASLPIPARPFMPARASAPTRREARARIAPARIAWGVALGLCLGVALPRPAAAGATPWVRSAQSEARLVGAGPLPGQPSGGAPSDAKPSGGPSLLAGVEIRLQPHFITYWRDPGDAGVPPTFSFAGSTNLRAATVRYPAPSRLDEAGAIAFGYAGGVVFPILVEPEDPSKPVALAVGLDYAACHDLCLPAHADLRLSLDPDPTPDPTPGLTVEAASVREALSAVPRPSTVGASRIDSSPGPAVAGVTAPDAAGGFTVRAAVPEGTEGAAALFVEAPEGWAYAAGAARPDGPGAALFPVKRLDAPPGTPADGAPGPAAPLTLTLVAPGGAVEVPATLDDARAKP